MIRKYHNPTLQSHRTFTVTRHQKNNKRQATSSLILVTMIARLERTQRNAYQSKDKHRIPTNNGRYNNSTTTEPPPLERTAEGGLKCILLVSNLRPRFFLTKVMQTNLIKLKHYNETKLRADHSQIELKKPQVELRWAQSKTSSRHQPTDLSFTSQVSLSLRPNTHPVQSLPLI